MSDSAKPMGDRQVGGVHRVAVEDLFRRPVDRRTALRFAGRSAAGFWLVGGIGGLAAACSGDGERSASTTVEPMGDLWSLSLEEVARLIADKQVSPVEVTQQELDRIARLNPQVNAFITVTPEIALAQARAAEDDIAAGRYRSPLQGIPIAHKDLYDTKGVRTTAGSKILADNIPDQDATVVALLAEAGAVTTGKLNMWELAAAISGTNPHYGAIRNPWNLDRITGGTSAGSGAAVAAGLVYAATGTDTGGSIRNPASYCGVVGLKPTYGRVSWHGALPGSPTLDHAGALARSVRDVAFVLQVIAGPDPLDPNTVDVPIPDYLEGIERGPRGLRIGLPTDPFWTGLDPGVESAARKAIDDLERAGAEVREVPYPPAQQYIGDASNMTGAQQIIFAIETGMSNAATFPSRRADYGKDLAALLDEVQGPESALQEALQGPTAVLRKARSGEADAILDGVDVLALPTEPKPPYTIAEAERLYERADIAELAAAVTGRNVGTFNLTGQPAISVPCGFTSDGLPVGLMFVARQWDEPTLLWAARSYEQVRGPFPMPPI